MEAYPGSLLTVNPETSSGVKSFGNQNSASDTVLRKSIHYMTTFRISFIEIMVTTSFI
jgi:hypothetical protein